MVLTDEEFANSLHSQWLKATATADDAKSKRDYYNAVFARETEKAEKLRTVLALYLGEPTAEDKTETDSAFSPETESEKRVPPMSEQTSDLAAAPEQFVSKKERVKRKVSELLGERGLLHRNDILSVLIAENIMGSEKSPLASLAAYLSEFKELFLPDGRGNFRLRPHGGVTNESSTVEVDQNSNGDRSSEADCAPEDSTEASSATLAKEEV